jgi:hypothetical protein
MMLNRKRIVAAMVATGIGLGALAGGATAFASASQVHSPVAAAANAPASAWQGVSCADWGKILPSNNPVTKATAGYLGLGQDRLRSELESGKSLADVAHAQGKPVSGLKAAMLAAVTSQINASSKLSAGQKAAAISDVKSHLGAIVTLKCRPT